MRHRWRGVCSGLVMMLGLVPGVAMAQFDAGERDAFEAEDENETVYEYNLSGPRFGATMTPLGAVSQFGWHSENQVAPGKSGPWFIVERVLLVGGMENNMFIPSGTLIFGVRLPSSFEFGIGPSVTLGLPGRGANVGVVAAMGQSFRIGGIRVPVNIAVAGNRGGEARVSLITGWAIRDSHTNPEPPKAPAPRPYDGTL